MRILPAALLAALVPFFVPTKDLAAGPDPCVGCKMTLEKLQEPAGEVSTQLLKLPGTETCVDGQCAINEVQSCYTQRPCQIEFMLVVTVPNSQDTLKGALYDKNGTQIGSTRNLPSGNGTAGFLELDVPREMTCSGVTNDFVEVKITRKNQGQTEVFAHYKVFCSECERIFGN